MSELKPKHPYVIDNPRPGMFNYWMFWLIAPVHVHLMLAKLPFLKSDTVDIAEHFVDTDRWSPDKIDGNWWEIQPMYDTDEAWLATVEAIDAYLAERAFEALWGSALEE
jgi:hypothetical protein